jgi:hypothetical protein
MSDKLRRKEVDGSKNQTGPWRRQEETFLSDCCSRRIEKLGQYDPKQDPPMVNIVEDKTLEWLNKGAQPTDTVRQLLRKQGIWAKYKA